MQQMEKTGIDLYTWNTPNGRKVSIMLEELGLDYRVIPIDITKGDQHEPEFDAMTLNHKIPVIVDHDNDMTLMESGAILLYLAEREGKLLCPPGPDRWQSLAWLMLQVAHVGPMLGQTHHFLKFNPGKAPYAEERYSTETQRLYGVLDRRLQDREYIAGEYSLVDIAIWPWIFALRMAANRFRPVPALRDWYVRIAPPRRAAGYGVPDAAEIPLLSELNCRSDVERDVAHVPRRPVGALPGPGSCRPRTCRTPGRSRTRCRLAPAQ